MKIIVQKFGGTSLKTSESRTRVCEIIKNTLNNDADNRVVVVVSAMGRENDPYATDTLINLAKNINPQIPARELDFNGLWEIISGVLLSAQLNLYGINAQFFTGSKAGIVTDDQHGDAHILYVNNQNLLKALKEGIVPVVAGFQGVSEKGEVTTLGRGGSDTTASALGGFKCSNHRYIYRCRRYYDRRS